MLTIAKIIALASVLLLPALLAEDKVLCEFEANDEVVCSGGGISTAQAAQGKQAYLWQDHPEHPILQFAKAEGDWSAWNTLSFQLHSKVANGAKFVIIASSENDKTEGIDYYLWEITVDWQGWRDFDLPFDGFRPSREPLGWDQINQLSWNASGWYNTPQPDTSLHIDNVRLRQRTYLEQLKPDAVSERLRTHLRPGHPRLFLTDERLAELKQRAETDEVLRAYAANVVRIAESQLDDANVPYGCDGKYHMLDKSRRVLSYVRHLALAYRWTGRKEFAEAAIRHMRAACEYPDWHPVHFLDAAELSHALGLGYDWLYDEMSPETRAMVRTAIVEKALRPGLAVYRWQKGWHRATNNWNQVCNGGLAVGALAVADEEYAVSAMVMQQVVKSLPHSLASYAPDGGWFEGPGYWQYAATYLSLGLDAMETALGTVFELDKSPGLAETALFPITMAGPTGYAFNYADCGFGRRSAKPCLFQFARRYNLPGVADDEHAYLGTGNMYRAQPGHVIWYLPPAGTAARLPLDSSYRAEIEVTAMRSGWHDPLALWVAVKAGRNSVPHAHLDVGGFVLDALGERFVHDLGADSYLLPGYFSTHSGKRWTYYRLSSDSHNVPKLGDTLQDPKAGGKVQRLETNSRASLFIADLSPVYAEKATSARRGVAMLDGRQGIVLRDEFVLRGPTPFLWGITTLAEVDVSDPRRAILTRNGKELAATLLAPAAASFSVASAERPKPEKQNKGGKRLQILLPGAQGNVQVAVQFSPVYDTPAPLKPGIFARALDEWQLPPEATNRLTEVRLAGALLDSFRPDQYVYHEVGPAGEALPEATATAADGKPVRIVASSATCPALVTITPAGGPAYHIRFVAGAPTKVALVAKVRGIQVTADAAVPGYGPANTLDDDLATRWSAQGDPRTLTYDLGKARRLREVRVAHFKGDERKATFQIHLSADGKAWQTVFDGASSGQSNGYQRHDAKRLAARYVQLICHGNADSAWSSITGVQFGFAD
jgi:hypothetical protein